MAKTGFIGPVILRDPDRRNGHKEHTGPQASLTPQFDSRLEHRFDMLDPSRIRELRKDPTISLLREIVLAPAVHTEWAIHEEKNAPEGAKDFIKKVFDPLRLDFLQRAFFGCLDFGWMPFEKVMVEHNGEIIYSKFKALLQDYTWIMVYVDTGDFAGYTNIPMSLGKQINEVFINQKESMLFNLEVEGTDWYGRSVSERLDETQKNWDGTNDSAKRYHTKVAGAHWVIWYPPGKTRYNGELTDNQDIARNLINTLEANGAISIPDDVRNWLEMSDNESKSPWRVELMSDTSNSQNTFTDRQKYFDSLKVRAFGIPERSVLEGKFGTKAEAEVHADIGLATVDTKHRHLVNQLNIQGVKPLMRLNYGEEVEDSVKIVVSPLVDSRFGVLRESFRLLLQSPNTIDDILPMMQVEEMMAELSLPSREPEEAEKIKKQRQEEKMAMAPQPSLGGQEDPKGQNSRQKEENPQDE